MTKTLPASTLQGLRNACCELGVNYLELLASVGLQHFPEESDDPVPANAIIQLLNNAQRLSGGAPVALLIAKHQGAHFLGSLGLMMAAAPDFGSAWSEANRYYQALRNPSLHWRFNPTPGHLHMSFGLHDINEAFSTTTMELTIAKTFSLSRSITRRRWKPLAVCFRHSRPPSLRIYREFFNTPLRFNAEFDGFLLDSNDFSIPLGDANANLHSALKELFAQSQQITDDSDFLSRARFFIAQGLAEGNCRVEDLARRFNISVRSLQRNLTQLGYPYQNLLSEARLEVGSFYLQQTDLRIEEIALRVGYQTSRTFCTAFKLQTGLTPLKWRKSVLQNPLGVPAGYQDYSKGQAHKQSSY